MTNSSTNKPPVWFWIVSVLALLWNGFGVLAYLGRAFITDEAIAALPEEQQAEFLIEFPSWVTAAFALAVFCGALGSLALLLRKKWANILLIISAITAIVHQGYLFMNVEIVSYIMPILIIAICIYLVFFAKQSTGKGWLN